MKTFRSYVTELSKGTLGRYAKAAMHDRESKKSDAESLSRVGHEVRKAGGKGSEKDAQRLFHKAGGAAMKAANRKTGHAKAVDKLTGQARVNAKEDVQLDEISQGVKDRYLRKSQDSHSHLSAVKRHQGNLSDEQKKKLTHKMKKRNQGMARAMGQTKDNW